MSYNLIDGHSVIRSDGTSTHRVVLVSSTDPSNDPLYITGADVDGLNDSDVIAAGSVLITPSANYIAFEDGSFSAKAGGTGSSSSNVSPSVLPASQTNFEALAKQTLTGKVIITIGDSYTAGMSTLLSTLATKYGMVQDNRGVVSATISLRSSDSYRRMPNMVDTIVSDYTNGKTINGTTYHASDVAIITFMGGANDGAATEAWIGARGANTTSQNTICGSLNYIFKSLLATFTAAKIIVVTQPANYATTVASVTTDSSAQELGFADLAELQVFDDYQLSNTLHGNKERAVKTMAWFYGLPVVDMFNEFPSMMVESNRSTYWNSDKLHLTTAGYTLIVDAIDEKIVDLVAKS